MKLVEAKLRIGLQQVAARDNAARTAELDRKKFARPAWRLLKIDA